MTLAALERHTAFQRRSGWQQPLTRTGSLLQSQATPRAFGVLTAMEAYTELNGVPVVTSQKYLRRLLRSQGNTNSPFTAVPKTTHLTSYLFSLLRSMRLRVRPSR